MTNVPSGSKRPWDGAPDKDVHKRPREDSRDWRDVHLRSPRGKPHSDRRDYPQRSRDYERRRSRDLSRDGGRRDDKERDRDRERRHDRERARDSYSRRDEPRRDDRRRHGSPRRQPEGSGPARHEDSEKEEGE